MSVELNINTEIVEINEVSEIITINDVNEIVEINFTGGIGPAGAGFPSGGTTNQVLAKNSNIDYDTEWVDAGAGTVTSVDMSVPTGFVISGNPITSLGTLALSMASGYSIPTNSLQTNWTAAYNDKINSAAVTGTTTKTLTLTQQDGGTIAASWTDDNTDAVTSVFGRTGAVVATSGDYSTTLVTEGTNLYYLDSRARASLSSIATGLTYNNLTGVFSLTSGYSIPTDANQSTWTTAYNDSIVSAGVSGTSTKTLTLNQQDGGTITATWSDIDTGLTSVGLSMPVAFSVANTPLTSNGTLAVTAIGTAAQYIRGDGQLATLPSGASGGSSVNYYLNGSVNQGTIGGSVYYEMNRNAVIGAGTDFTRTNLQGDGLIAQFITDANDPNRLEIPSGAWNFEMYFNSSSAGGTPAFYVELLKYNGTTFTSIANGSTNPEGITGGTSTDLYLTSLAVPQTTLLATDRLAIRVYVITSGKDITLHTEDNNLCEIITTFAGGIAALNGLTANTQYFAVGTSGTDFAISSLSDTHTFNLPDASLTARGLVTIGQQTFSGGKTFNDGLSVNAIFRLSTFGATFQNTGSISTPQVNYGVLYAKTDKKIYYKNSDGTDYDLTNAGSVTSISLATGTSGTDVNVSGSPITSNGTITLNIPDASATARGALSSSNWTLFNNKQPQLNGTGFVKASGTTISYDNSTYLTTSSATSTYVPYSGATTSVNLGSNPLLSLALLIKEQPYNSFFTSSGYTSINSSATYFAFSKSVTQRAMFLYPSGTYIYTLPDASGTIALTSDLTGGTVTSVAALTIGTTGTDVNSSVANSTTTPVITLNIPDASATARGVVTTGTQTFVGAKTFNNAVTVNGTTIFNAQVRIDSSSIVIKETGGVSTPSATFGFLYAKDDKKIWYKNSDGTDYDLTANSGGTVTSVGLSSATSGVTIGSTPVTTSGTITLAIATASGSQQGLLSSTDWTTFNNKQNALTNPVTGTGTINYIPKFTATGSTIGNSDLRTDANNNLGLGVTPSAWNLSGMTAMQIKNAAFFGYLNNAYVGGNAYYDGGWKFIANGGSTLYAQYSSTGEHQWLTSNSLAGTAGNAITFTQALTLTAAGRLLLGTSTESTYLLDVNGSGRFTGDVLVTSAGSTTITSSGTMPILDLIRTNNSTAATAQINFKTSQGTVRWQIGTTQVIGTGFEINEGNAISNRFYIAPGGAATFSSSVTASSLIKSGGTSTQYLMADGSTSTLTNPVTGTGTINYIPKFTATGSTIGNSDLRTDANNNLGLGVTPSAWNTGYKAMQITSWSSIASDFTYNGATDIITNAYIGTANSSDWRYISTATATRYRQQDGFHAWYQAISGTAGNPITFTQAMTLGAGGNLLVGTTTDSGFKLLVQGASGNIARITDGTNNLDFYAGSSLNEIAATNTLLFSTNNLERVRINSSGNLGLGVTPSAWDTVTPVFQIGKASFYGYNNEARLSANYFYQSGDKYIASDFATSYLQASGQHKWFNAPSGTAGNAITFTQAMTLTANGRLLVGTATEGTAYLDVVTSGTAVGGIKLTSSTNTNGVGYLAENAGGSSYFGRNNSGGGAYGGTGYATVVYSGGAYPMSFYTNDTERLTISSTGAATFSSSVTATSFVKTGGTSAQYLMADGSVTTGGGSGITRSVNTISTATTAAATSSTDYVYFISGTTTLTMPTAVGNTNRYTLKNTGTNVVTINTTSSQTIDGSASATISVQYTSIEVISNGSNWNII